MANSNSIVVFKNTIVMYVKIIVTTIIWLYLTRVVLDVLGVEDFGIYNLIAGVIAMLSFVNSALMSSTQRFFSYAIGEKNKKKLKEYYESGIIIHTFIAFLLVLLFEVSSLFIFDGFLNIPSNRLSIAKLIFQLMIISTVASVISVPFNAAINANEDIWYLGIVQIGSAIFKLLVIFVFNKTIIDNLVLYTSWLALATIVELPAVMIWCRIRYGEAKRINLNISKHINSIKDMLGFSGWNTFGAFAVVCRNQGISVLLNVFFGPAINAVFGIANQIDSQLISFANTLTSAISPQIVKSRGEGNNERLILLSVFSSKLTFFLCAIFALPLIIELPLVLHFWLKTVPEYTEIYCIGVLSVFLVCELYPGLNRGIQAVGDIKWQQILSSAAVVLPIPIGAILFSFGVIHYYIMVIMLIMQIVSFVISLIFSRKLFSLDVCNFILFTAKAIFIFACFLFVGKYLDSLLLGMNSMIRFCIVCTISMALFSFIYYILCFDSQEKNMINTLFKRLINY